MSFGFFDDALAFGFFDDALAFGLVDIFGFGDEGGGRLPFGLGDLLGGRELRGVDCGLFGGGGFH